MESHISKTSSVEIMSKVVFDYSKDAFQNAQSHKCDGQVKELYYFNAVQFKSIVRYRLLVNP